jgi:hypothetical protein
MSLIKNAKGRIDGNSGYSRLMGNEELGNLFSKIQSTVISNGNELETLIENSKECIKDFDNFIISNPEPGNYLCAKNGYKKSKNLLSRKIQPDFLIFNIENNNWNCKIVEMKDGDNFDTKKSEGELEHLQKFTEAFKEKYPFINTNFYICCFNQNNKETIVNGLKKRFSIDNVMTGKEFCNFTDINYDEIKQKRKNDQTENINYFIEEISKIPIIMEKLNAENKI